MTQQGGHCLGRQKQERLDGAVGKSADGPTCSNGGPDGSGDKLRVCQRREGLGEFQRKEEECGEYGEGAEEARARQPHRGWVAVQLAMGSHGGEGLLPAPLGWHFLSLSGTKMEMRPVTAAWDDALKGVDPTALRPHCIPPVKSQGSAGSGRGHTARGTLSSSENSIRSSRVQLRPMGETFSMPFRNSMNVPLVVEEVGDGELKPSPTAAYNLPRSKNLHPPTHRWGLSVPRFYVSLGTMPPCWFLPPPLPRGPRLGAGTSPLLGQSEQGHVAEAEVDQVLQQLLPQVVLDGLHKGNRAGCSLGYPRAPACASQPRAVGAMTGLPG